MKDLKNLKKKIKLKGPYPSQAIIKVIALITLLLFKTLKTNNPLVSIIAEKCSQSKNNLNFNKSL
jgi:hypothetical protein